MVVHTDQVRGDGVTEDSQAPSHTEETVEDEHPQVRQFNWSPNQALTMMVPIWIGSRQVMAVVDTAAQVTIISCALSEELGCEPPVEKVQLRNAQQDSWMDGGIHERFGFQLGSRKYYWDVIEADIGDSFIIGIDFLKSVKCKIDLDGNNLELANGDRIPATMKRNADGEAVHVSRVLLHRKTTIPPKSMKLVKAKLESPAEVPFLLKTAESSSVFAVPVMVEGKGPLKVCVVNLGEELVSLQRKQNLATTIEIDAMVDGQDSEEPQENDTGGCDVRAVQTGGDTDEGQVATVECHSDSESTLEEQELPEHLRCLYEECQKRLTTEQAKFVRELLIEFADVFATHDLDIGRFTVFAHRIGTGKAMSLRKSMRRTPLGFDHDERKTLKAMLDAKVIEPSQSEWASRPVLVQKKDRSWHYCIKFRGLNAVTTRDAYPLRLIEECIDSLADMQWYSALDMNSGYWQIPVAEEDKEKTAFITKYGLFHFLRMPFGLSNAPATFQRTMNLVLSGLIWVNVIVYLDDMNVSPRPPAITPPSTRRTASTRPHAWHPSPHWRSPPGWSSPSGRWPPPSFRLSSRSSPCPLRTPPLAPPRRPLPPTHRPHLAHLSPRGSPHWRRSLPLSLHMSASRRPTCRVHSSTAMSMKHHFSLLHEPGEPWLIVWWPLQRKTKKTCVIVATSLCCKCNTRNVTTIKKSLLLCIHFSASAPNHYIHQDTLQERELGQRHCSLSPGDISQTQQGKTDINGYGYIHYWPKTLHRNNHLYMSNTCPTIADPGISDILNCSWISITNSYPNTDLESSSAQLFPSPC